MIQPEYSRFDYAEVQPARAQHVRQMSPDEERTWGMVSHLVPLAAMVLSAGVLGFVASVLLYVLVKDRGPFVRQHAASSVNVQSVTGIVLLISIPLMYLVIGFVTYGSALVFAFVVHVIGAIKANRGQWYNPPLTPRFVN